MIDRGKINDADKAILAGELCTECWKEKSTRTYRVSMTTEIEDAKSSHVNHKAELIKTVHWCYDCVKFKANDWDWRIEHETGKINE